MNTHLFLITAKTNLHVGNEGGSEFSIIDNAIQRDVLTGLPCINSSSLKGAIKEFCCSKNIMGEDNIKKIFGSDKSAPNQVNQRRDNGNDNEYNNEAKNDHQKGSAIFYDAKLLFLPIQTTDKDNGNSLFKYTTNEQIITQMNTRLKLLKSNYKFILQENFRGVNIDKIGNIADFRELCNDDNLPIIARNCLENGESKNLWYEQVLPAETVLYAIIQEEGEILANTIDKKIIQIGANATIGYGYCHFKKLTANNENPNSTQQQK